MTSLNNVAIARVRSADGLPDRLRLVYEDAFRDCEREDWSAHEQGVEDGSRLFHVLSVGGDPVGLAITVVLPHVQGALLAYLAVDEPFRGMRLGRTLLRIVQDEVASLGLMGGLYLEVEPAQSPDLDERAWQHKRLAWYYDQGAVEVDGVEYATPSTTDSEPLPFHLLLMRPGRSTPPPPRRVVEAIYESVYARHRDVEPVRRQVLASCR